MALLCAATNYIHTNTHPHSSHPQSIEETAANSSTGPPSVANVPLQPRAARDGKREEKNNRNNAFAALAAISLYEGKGSRAALSPRPPPYMRPCGEQRDRICGGDTKIFYPHNTRDMDGGSGGISGCDGMRGELSEVMCRTTTSRTQ